MIRELREAQGLTQEALAFKAKLGVSTVRRFENGYTNEVTTGTLKKLAAVLGPEVYDLLKDQEGGAA